MSRTDPGAATRRQPYLPSRCTCTHLATLHAFNSKGMRAGCTKRGLCPCDCKVFVTAEAVPR